MRRLIKYKDLRLNNLLKFIFLQAYTNRTKKSVAIVLRQGTLGKFAVQGWQGWGCFHLWFGVSDTHKLV